MLFEMIDVSDLEMPFYLPPRNGNTTMVGSVAHLTRVRQTDTRFLNVIVGVYVLQSIWTVDFHGGAIC